jgi:hypothetical protein
VLAKDSSSDGSPSKFFGFGGNVPEIPQLGDYRTSALHSGRCSQTLKTIETNSSLAACFVVISHSVLIPTFWSRWLPVLQLYLKINRNRIRSSTRWEDIMSETITNAGGRANPRFGAV